MSGTSNKTQFVNLRFMYYFEGVVLFKIFENKTPLKITYCTVHVALEIAEWLNWLNAYTMPTNDTDYSCHTKAMELI